jgi:hypothetical protein
MGRSRTLKLSHAMSSCRCALIAPIAPSAAGSRLQSQARPNDRSVARSRWMVRLAYFLTGSKGGSSMP